MGEQLKGVTGCNHMSFILGFWLFLGMVLNDFDVTLAHWIVSFFLCSSEQNEDETSLKNGLSASANSSVSCSGTSIICFYYLTARPVVIQVYSPGLMPTLVAVEFHFYRSGKDIYLYGFSLMKSNFQSNFLKYDGTVHCLNLETLNSESLALLLSLRPSAGGFVCKSGCS